MVPEPDYGFDTYEGHGRRTGKIALITGADSGIGRAVALAFAREGADIAIGYHRHEDDARESARVVAAAGSLIERGIRVSCVAPGPVWTPLVVQSFSAKKNARFGEDSPMGRPAQPAELAPAFVFLASAEATNRSSSPSFAGYGSPKRFLEVVDRGGMHVKVPFERGVALLAVVARFTAINGRGFRDETLVRTRG